MKQTATLSEPYEQMSPGRPLSIKREGDQWRIEISDQTGALEMVQYRTVIPGPIRRSLARAEFETWWRGAPDLPVDRETARRIFLAAWQAGWIQGSC